MHKIAAQKSIYLRLYKVHINIYIGIYIYVYINILLISVNESNYLCPSDDAQISLSIPELTT